MNIVGLIPARGGSKGIIRKNMTPCAGQPLIQYTFQAAQTATKLGRVFLSTDDQSIANFGKNSGIEVPFLRPVELASDQTAMIDVIEHFFHWLNNKNIAVDGVMLLQPTSPLRKADHIDDAILMFEKQCPESLVSVVKIPHNFSPKSLMQFEGCNLKRCNEEPIYRRQDKTEYYARNGPAILIVTQKAVLENNLYAEPCLGYEMDYVSSFDVDDHEGLKIAEIMIESQNQRKA